ncbi:MAG TPA: glycosyltransferase [Anaerolineales bacterium]|nr:glycosyltransferase [Anaerolineales bacterium]
MRILIVNQRFWPAASGSERWLLAIARRLAAAGHSVSVATTDALDGDAASNPRARRSPERTEQHAGVRILRFPLAHLPGSPLTYAALRYSLLPWLAGTPVPQAWLSALARQTPRAPELYDWLSTGAERFDLVLGANILFDGMAQAAAEAARRWGVPFVFVPFTHLGAGRRPGGDPVGRHYTGRWQTAIVCGADRVLTMTETERAYYVEAGAPATAVHVVGAGVEADVLQPGDPDRFRAVTGISGPIAAYLAPLHRDKGLHQVVDALERHWPRIETLNLVAVGAPYPGGSQRLALLNARRPGQVHVFDAIDESFKRDLLAAADQLVMPSRTDSFGIVFLEAWAQGKPVIGSTAWGMSDVITPEADGLLVRFGDIAATAEAMWRLHNDAALRERLGVHGRDQVTARHLWDHVYARVCAACEGLGL